MRIPYISLAAASALALGGCAYGDLGLGVGYGSPYYGYDYGYGTPYYGAGYYGGFPYYGWYDNYYYPGSGYYVYDTYRRPHVMTVTQRQYWSTRSPALRTSSTTRVRPNWSGFNRHATTKAERQAAREQRQQAREQRQDRFNRPY